MSGDPSRQRLARATAAAHRAIARATRSIIRAHRRRAELFGDLAKAYQAEADALEDGRVAEGLRTHARFAEKFISLTTNEILNLEQEAERAEVQARTADARSRGDTRTRPSPAAPRGRCPPAGRSAASRQR